MVKGKSKPSEAQIDTLANPFPRIPGMSRTARERPKANHFSVNRDARLRALLSLAIEVTSYATSFAQAGKLCPSRIKCEAGFFEGTL